MNVDYYRSLAAFERVDPALVERAARYAVAMIGDVAGRRGAMNARIQAVGAGMRVAGPAFTVEVRPGDNLMLHVAAAIAQPGDVIVVDDKNDQTCGLTGELMVTQAKAAGVAGFVVDGAVRDTAELAELGLPVFASGRNPCGPTKNIPGRLSIPVSVGGVAVAPGDLVIGDSEGVIVVPRRDAARILDQMAAKVAMEKQRLDEISRGDLVPPWLDEAMRVAGILAPGQSVVDAFRHGNKR